MLAPRNVSATVEDARTDTVVQLAIDFIMRTAAPLSPYYVLARGRIKKPRISARRVAAMHMISFSQLQRSIVAGGELQTRSEAHRAEMVLTISEAALEDGAS